MFPFNANFLGTFLNGILGNPSPVLWLLCKNQFFEQFFEPLCSGFEKISGNFAPVKGDSCRVLMAVPLMCWVCLAVNVPAYRMILQEPPVCALWAVVAAMPSTWVGILSRAPSRYIPFLCVRTELYHCLYGNLLGTLVPDIGVVCAWNWGS